MNKLRALQLGQTDWNVLYQVPMHLSIEHKKQFLTPHNTPYDLVFIDKSLSQEEAKALYACVKAYTLFFTEAVELKEVELWLMASRKGKILKMSSIQSFLINEASFYYSKPYGEKYQMENLGVSDFFRGEVIWRGHCEVVLKGDFGMFMNQVLYWKNNIPVFKNQMLDFWLEYEKSPEVEVTLMITRLAAGTESEIIGREEISNEALDQIIQIKAGPREERLFISIHAKGKGELHLIALHDRYSRGSHGYFLPGGERFVTSKREEVFCYFEPMDRKPPLNVYFAGYKTLQGFEGYHMMRNLGCPFLLIAEPRLEGGSFYMGTKEYEDMVLQAILGYMDELSFSNKDVILSGLSMGTFGALYYGCKLNPCAIILGKPLASIGTVAANEKRHRPGGFPTSLDVVTYLCQNTNLQAVEKLNKKFWECFDAVKWEDISFIISYMIEDDYDADAYQTMLSHIHSDRVRVFGKGFHGRHNDNTNGIVQWFIYQYRTFIREKFDRGVTKEENR